MSQTFNLPIGTTGVNVAAWRTIINDFGAALRSAFSGTAFPGTPVDGQFCLRTDQRKLYVYEGATWVLLGTFTGISGSSVTSTFLKPDGTVPMAADFDLDGFRLVNVDDAVDPTDAPNLAQVDSVEKVSVVQIGTVNATTSFYVWLGGPLLSNVEAFVVVQTTVAASGAAYWQFKVRNVTAGVDLRATDKDTQAGLTAETSFDLALGQNKTPAAGAVLKLTCTKVGAVADLVNLSVAIKYTSTAV